MSPRLRIAPSPTGEPHVGTAYTALFNILLARKLGGEMILRIEDTDQSRSTPDSERKVMEALNWLGLNWTEGPDKGGAYGPYRQSERRDIYAPYVEELLDNGHAFKCFCSRERLETMRKAQQAKGQQPKYDGHCLSLTAEEVRAKEAEGEVPVVRMKIPTNGACAFEDGIYGAVSIPWDTIDMQVILKADGMPTYHLANVVDDHLMKITHVARGEEWLSSVPKHILLYQYFGWQAPQFIHLPLLRNLDRSKLSKRRNPTSISYFSTAGYLPEALVNFLGLGFVSIAEGEELMTLDELSNRFELSALSKAGAVFDLQKLDWLNGRWIREKLGAQDFAARMHEWSDINNRLLGGLALAQARCVKLSDVPMLIAFLLSDKLDLTREHFAATKTGVEESLAILEAVAPTVETLGEWDKTAIEAEIRRISDETGRKIRIMVAPLYLAITGSTKSLPLFDSMELLGRSMVRQRLRHSIALLKG
ncbi:glutamate--tRNA ligase [Methylovirgula sp. 4M-Z18]|uniref:glutamate--tRNA ligase n=1 Tax=Methylovirgula sp. 4M-Z18 TaxID=2293567 RepID=UPI000E2FF302|nr:glutamate--tRNA ligase [Methylovirgula sp. 4M-Z18]RFB81042.1 glutamate--tRNA ligase [Methylovirgula sp. 4M-Z18]